MKTTSLETINSDPAIGDVLNNYLITAVIKYDKKGNVYRAKSCGVDGEERSVIIKQGRAGIEPDRYERPMQDRLEWQMEVQQELHKVINTPKIVALFINNRNHYLVMDFIEGITLSKQLALVFKNNRWSSLPKKKKKALIRILLKVTHLIQCMHKAGYVHRDLTPENVMITPDGDVYMIDFELSFDLRKSPSSPPYEWGSYGFMSPQQQLSITPTTQEDIYSIGALLLATFSNFPPSKFDREVPAQLQKAMQLLTIPEKIREIISACLLGYSYQRWQISSIRQSLREQYVKHDRISRLPASDYQVKVPFFNEVKRLLRSALLGLIVDRKAEIENLYRNEHNEGLSIPVHGIVYVLTELGLSNIPSKVLSYVKKAFSENEVLYQKAVQANQPGLFCGLAGNVVGLYSACEARFIPTDDDFVSSHEWLSIIAPKLDLAEGAAGQALACLLLLQKRPDPVLQNKLKHIVAYLLSNQEADGAWPVTALRIADGNAGILLVLLKYYAYSADQSLQLAIRKGLDFIAAELEKQQAKGSLIQRSEVKDISLMGGTSGIALIFLYGYELLKDTGYKAIADKLLSNINRQVCIPDFSLESGLTGIGIVYIEAARITGHKKWLERASWIYRMFASLCICGETSEKRWNMRGKKEEDYSLLSGSSGIIYFLIRMQNLLSPDDDYVKGISLI